jgi:hypothetical protein
MQNLQIKKFWLYLLPASVGFLLGLPFDPEDGRSKFLQSVGEFLLDYVLLYPQ